MHKRVLDTLRIRMRAGAYTSTVHADEEMVEDDVDAFDVEHAILTGRIVGRQRDKATGEWKYLVRGEIGSGDGLLVVAKPGRAGRVVIVTVYRV